MTRSSPAPDTPMTDAPAVPDARRARSALSDTAEGTGGSCPPTAAPAGWALVPIEPTEQMIGAYITAIRNSRKVRLRDLSREDWYALHQQKCRERWRGMLAAAGAVTRQAETIRAKDERIAHLEGVLAQARQNTRTCSEECYADSEDTACLLEAEFTDRIAALEARYARLRGLVPVEMNATHVIEERQAQINALMAEVARLRRALEPFARYGADAGSLPDDTWLCGESTSPVRAKDFRRARAALTSAGEGRGATPAGSGSCPSDGYPSRKATLATLIHECVRFAVLAAGEGICIKDETDQYVDPAEALFAAASALDMDDWADLPTLASGIDTPSGDATAGRGPQGEHPTRRGTPSPEGAARQRGPEGETPDPTPVSHEVWRDIATAPTVCPASLIIDMDAPEPAPVIAHRPEDGDGIWLGGYPEDWDRDPIRAGQVLGEYMPTHWMPLPSPPPAKETSDDR